MNKETALDKYIKFNEIIYLGGNKSQKRVLKIALKAFLSFMAIIVIISSIITKNLFVSVPFILFGVMVAVNMLSALQEKTETIKTELFCFSDNIYLIRNTGIDNGEEIVELNIFKRNEVKNIQYDDINDKLCIEGKHRQITQIELGGGVIEKVNDIDKDSTIYCYIDKKDMKKLQSFIREL